MSGAATWSAGLAMLADTFGPDERGRRPGLTIGPLAGGLLVAGFTFRLAVLGHAVLLAAVGVGTYLSIRQTKSD